MWLCAGHRATMAYLFTFVKPELEFGWSQSASDSGFAHCYRRKNDKETAQMVSH